MGLSNHSIELLQLVFYRGAYKINLLNGILQSDSTEKILLDLPIEHGL